MPAGDTEHSRLRVQEIYAAYMRGDMPFVMDALTEDVAWISGDAPTTPWCGCHVGKAGVQAYFAALAAECAIVDYRIGTVIADGDRVAVTATVRARYHHNAAEREVAKVDVLRLRDGLICEFREYYDTAQIAADLGR